MKEEGSTLQDTDAEDSAWLLLNCPGCGVSIKTPSTHAGKTLKCPSCGAFVECRLVEAEGDREDDPSLETGVPHPLELLPILDEDDDLSEPGEFKGLVSDEIEAEKSLRRSPAVRDKRTRKRMDKVDEGLQWDVVEPIQSEESEYFEYIDQRTGEHHRVKRHSVEEEPEPTNTQLLVKTIGTLGVLGLLALAVALIASGVFKSADVGMEDSSEINQQGPEADLKDGAALLALEIPPVVVEAEAESCKQLANDFYAALTVNERVEFVRQPDRVQPLMEQWYGKHEIAPRQFSEILAQRKIIDNGRFFITLAMRFGEELLDVQFLAFEQLGKDKFLLDWEISESYQQMPIAKFKDARPVDPVDFRVNASLTNYYGGEFDRQEYQSIKMIYPNQSDFYLIGYVERGSETGTRLISQLELQAPFPCILKLAYPENGRTEDEVLITGIELLSWFY